MLLMSQDAISVEVRGILPANSGCAVFIGNEEKVFVIQVEHNMLRVQCRWLGCNSANRVGTTLFHYKLQVSPVD